VLDKWHASGGDGRRDTDGCLTAVYLMRSLLLSQVFSPDDERRHIYFPAASTKRSHVCITEMKTLGKTVGDLPPMYGMCSFKDAGGNTLTAELFKKVDVVPDVLGDSYREERRPGYRARRCTIKEMTLSQTLSQAETLVF